MATAVTEATTLKTIAHRMIDLLPDDATWDDLLDKILMRQAIERGIKDADEGRVYTIEEVYRKLGIER